jgi:hypothetical protein
MRHREGGLMMTRMILVAPLLLGIAARAHAQAPSWLRSGPNVRLPL